MKPNLVVEAPSKATAPNSCHHSKDPYQSKP